MRAVHVATFFTCLSAGTLCAIGHAQEAPTLARAPDVLTTVTATYPEVESGRPASVLLAITIDADGRVEDVAVVESDGPAFDEAAMNAVWLFAFRPAEVAGAPARARIRFRYDFPAREPVEPEASAPQQETTPVAAPAQGPEEDIGVTARIEAPEIPEAVVSEVSAEQARTLAGSGGEVALAVNNLSGVARTPIGSSGLVIWGAASEDTGIYIDGVRIPRLYHDGGLRSVVGTELVRSVALIPGGYGAAHGRGIGGLVIVDTLGAPEDDAVHASVAADLYDASASVRSRMGSRVSVALAGRASYVAPLLDAIASSDIEALFPFPHYRDFQARLGVRLREQEHIDVTVLSSSDSTTRVVDDADPARATQDRRSLAFYRAYVRYGRTLDTGATVAAVLYVGGEERDDTRSYGDLVTTLGTETLVVGLRGSISQRVARWLRVEGGVDGEYARVRVARDGSLGIPAREGDIRVFGQPPPESLASDRYDVVLANVAPYTQARATAWEDRIALTLGLRLEPYVRSISRTNPGYTATPDQGLYTSDFRASPRAAIRVAPHPRVFAHAAVGRYDQPPSAADLSANAGNPALPPSQAEHYVVGAGGLLASVLTLEVTAFLTNARALAMRSDADAPATGEALLPTGASHTRGAQLTLKLDPTRGVFGFISYTAQRNDRRDAPDVPLRPSDYEQRHVLTSLLGARFGDAWEIGARLRVATGLPRTSVVGAAYDLQRGIYQPVFGAHNGIRIRTFAQLDVRLAKRFRIRGTELLVSLDIQNVTNRRNVEEIVYDADYTTRGAIHGLPILPVLGLRWTL